MDLIHKLLGTLGLLFNDVELLPYLRETRVDAGLPTINGCSGTDGGAGRVFSKLIPATDQSSIMYPNMSERAVISH